MKIAIFKQLWIKRKNIIKFIHFLVCGMSCGFMSGRILSNPPPVVEIFIFGLILTVTLFLTTISFNHFNIHSEIKAQAWDEIMADHEKNRGKKK